MSGSEVITLQTYKHTEAPDISNIRSLPVLTAAWVVTLHVHFYSFTLKYVMIVCSF